MLGFTAMFTLLRDDPPPLNFSDYWFIGVICSLLACFGTVCGMLLQKYSHNLDPRIDGNAARKNRLWWTSLFLMIVVPAPLDVIALGLAAQSLLAPLTAVTLLLTVIMAPCFLPEKILPIDIVATILVCAGAIVSTWFGPHTQKTFDVPALYELYSRWSFIVMQTLVIASIVVVLLWIMHSPDPFESPFAKERRVEPDPEPSIPPPEPIKRQWWHLPHKAIPFAHAYVAGLTGAQQMVLTKTVSELLFLSFDGRSQMHYALTYIVTVLAAAFAAFQIWYLSSGLERFDAIFYLSIYNAMLIVFNIVCGGIYFDEFKHTSWRQFLLFCLGTVIVIAGVLVLTERPPLHDQVAYQQLPQDDASQPNGTSPDEEQPQSQPARSAAVASTA